MLLYTQDSKISQWPFEFKNICSSENINVVVSISMTFACYIYNKGRGGWDQDPVSQLCGIKEKVTCKGGDVVCFIIDIKIQPFVS